MYTPTPTPTRLSDGVHIPRMKGRTVTVYKEGKRTDSLVFESCIRPNFFELSFVFDPADESAWLTDKRRY